MKEGIYTIVFIALALMISSGNVVSAQSVSDAKAVNNIDQKIKKSRAFSVNRMPSLLFTYWQHQSILDAKNKRGVVRPPTQAELEALERGDDVGPKLRDISLGGIVYKGKGDWTIWLNGERVTPMAVPEEVLDLRVYKDHIEVKWIDDHTNQIFPIRLRAHERFNMDMRIFLPG